VSYRLVDELQTKAVPVAQTCRLLGVSRAGFYEAKRRAATPLKQWSLYKTRGDSNGSF